MGSTSSSASSWAWTSAEDRRRELGLELAACASLSPEEWCEGSAKARLLARLAEETDPVVFEVTDGVFGRRLVHDCAQYARDVAVLSYVLERSPPEKGAEDEEDQKGNTPQGVKGVGIMWRPPTSSAARVDSDTAAVAPAPATLPSTTTVAAAEDDDKPPQVSVLRCAAFNPWLTDEMFQLLVDAELQGLPKEMQTVGRCSRDNNGWSFLHGLADTFTKRLVHPEQFHEFAVIMFRVVSADAGGLDAASKDGTTPRTILQKSVKGSELLVQLDEVVRINASSGAGSGTTGEAPLAEAPTNVGAPESSGGRNNNNNNNSSSSSSRRCVDGRVHDTRHASTGADATCDSEGGDKEETKQGAAALSERELGLVRVLEQWMHACVPSILDADARRYATALVLARVTTVARLQKRVQQEPAFLATVVHDPDDCDDMLAAIQS